MGTQETAKQFEELIGSLQQRYDELRTEMNKIEATFRRYGIPLQAKKGRNTTTASTVNGNRSRSTKFKTTGVEAIFTYIKKNSGQASTRDINEMWQQEGRGGKANNTLTKLVQDGKLKRKKNPDGYGSLYTLPSSTTSQASKTKPKK